MMHGKQGVSALAGVGSQRSCLPVVCARRSAHLYFRYSSSALTHDGRPMIVVPATGCRADGGSFLFQGCLMLVPEFKPTYKLGGA